MRSLNMIKVSGKLKKLMNLIVKANFTFIVITVTVKLNLAGHTTILNRDIVGEFGPQNPPTLIHGNPGPTQNT